MSFFNNFIILQLIRYQQRLSNFPFGLTISIHLLIKSLPHQNSLNFILIFELIMLYFQIFISKFLIICKIPPSPAILITPIIPFSGKINPIRMTYTNSLFTVIFTKFIANKIQISISTHNKSYHFYNFM